MDAGINESRINKAIIYSEKEYITSQHDKIENFYKEYYTYDVSNIGYWIITGIFIFIQVIFLTLPYEQLNKEGFDAKLAGIMGALVGLPVNFYLQAYIRHNEKGYMGSMYNKVKYLPVSLKSMRKFRFRKMLKFVLNVFFVCAVLQLGLSIIFFHRIILGTVIYLILYGFLVPFVVGCSVALCTK